MLRYQKGEIEGQGTVGTMPKSLGAGKINPPGGPGRGALLGGPSGPT